MPLVPGRDSDGCSAQAECALGQPSTNPALTCKLLGFVGLGIQQPGVRSTCMTNLHFNTVVMGLTGNVSLPVKEFSSYHWCYNTSLRMSGAPSVSSQFQLKYQEFWHCHLPLRLMCHSSRPFLILLPNLRFLLVKFITVYFLFLWYLSHAELQGEKTV